MWVKAFTLIAVLYVQRVFMYNYNGAPTSTSSRFLADIVDVAAVKTAHPFSLHYNIHNGDIGDIPEVVASKSEHFGTLFEPFIYPVYEDRTYAFEIDFGRDESRGHSPWYGGFYSRYLGPSSIQHDGAVSASHDDVVAIYQAYNGREKDEYNDTKKENLNEARYRKNEMFGIREVCSCHGPSSDPPDRPFVYTPETVAAEAKHYADLSKAKAGQYEYIGSHVPSADLSVDSVLIHGYGAIPKPTNKTVMWKFG